MENIEKNIDGCMNRCIGYNKNNRKCRAITKNNSLFCSPCHEPLNRELIDGECFMCIEKVTKSSDIIFFKCKHAFHKECYFEWVERSNNINPICMLCRNEIDFLKDKKIKFFIDKYKKISYEELDNINKLDIILIKKKIFY
jgi:hypothetical protein